jgi:hypothetical protein
MHRHVRASSLLSIEKIMCLRDTYLNTISVSLYLELDTLAKKLGFICI